MKEIKKAGQSNTALCSDYHDDGVEGEGKARFPFLFFLWVVVGCNGGSFSS